MFKFGRKTITIAIERKSSNAFLSVLESKALSTNISTSILASDDNYRIYEFEAVDKEYDEILDCLDTQNINYKRQFFDSYGRETYIGLI